MKIINDFFKLQEKGSTIGKELIAGITTFLSMAYILVANPLILSDGAGMDKGGVFIATVIAAAVGTLVMGLLANYPVALAPGMGMNAFFAFTVALPVAYGGMGYTYQQALAGVFVSGLIFVLLAISGIREKIINAIPNNLKLAVGAGIGLFIAFIGLKGSGIITYTLPVDGVNPTQVFPKLGDLGDPAILVAVIGLLITIILYVKKVPAAIFLGLILTTIVSIILGQSGEAIEFDFSNNHIGSLFEGFKSGVWDFRFFIVIFTLLFLDFFDTAGTLVTVGRRAGLVNEEGVLQGSSKALLADATATVIGAVAGTSSTTSYIESLSGVEAGGRTGLTSVFTAILFMLSIFLLPLSGFVTFAVTAPALIMIGILMASQLKEIEWNDLAVAVPAFLTILIMPLAYSISVGIALGFIFYPITLIATKRHKEVNPIMYILAVVFIIYFLTSSNTVMDPIYDLFK